MRSYFDQVAFIIFNKDKNPRKIDFEIPERFLKSVLKANFGAHFKQEKNILSLTLEGNSFEILTN